MGCFCCPHAADAAAVTASLSVVAVVAVVAAGAIAGVYKGPARDRRLHRMLASSCQRPSETLQTCIPRPSRLSSLLLGWHLLAKEVCPRPVLEDL